MGEAPVAPRPVVEVAWNPQIDFGTVTHDGKQIALLSVHHPRHGIIDIVIPWSAVTNFSLQMSRMLDEREVQGTP